MKRLLSIICFTVFYSFVGIATADNKVVVVPLVSRGPAGPGYHIEVVETEETLTFPAGSGNSMYVECTNGVITGGGCDTTADLYLRSAFPSGLTAFVCYYQSGSPNEVISVIRGVALCLVQD